MAASVPILSLEEVTLAVYCAMDDALREVGVKCTQGRLLPRRGPPPEIDDREVLCLAVLQEILGFESDHAYFLWLHANPIMHSLFPRLLSRQKFAERRAVLTPLMERLTAAFCVLDEGAPPFSLSIPIRSMSAS